MDNFIMDIFEMDILIIDIFEIFISKNILTLTQRNGLCLLHREV